MSNNKQKLELTWIGKNNPEYDIANIEPRILEERTDLSYGDKDTENMIIHGDNLLALKALLPEYEGKVKCIYIDPPYNTGNAFEHYDDSVEHSTWLSLMRTRLEILRTLLSDDGSIFISIDNNEISYLQVLLDEIFDRKNRKNIITVKRGSVTGAKVINPGLVNISEFIVVYTKNTGKWSPNRLSRKKDRDARYGTYIANFEEDYSQWKFIPLLQAVSAEVGIKSTQLKKHLGDEYDVILEQFVYKNAYRVIQFATLDEKNVSKDAVEIKKKSKDDPETTFLLERKGKKPYYIHNGKLILFIKDRLSEIDGAESFSEPLTDIWDDVLPNDLHNEGGVVFKKGKKSEKLIQRIFQLASNNNDWVLDSFLGSGTTAAVSHKMGRKYIGIEMGEHAYTHCKVRLDKVVDGSDQGGISKAVEWKGGGGYKFYELAPSFVAIDEFGNPVIDSYYNDTKLIRAMCKLTNYTFAPNPTDYWKQGKGQGNNSIYVTTQMLSVAMVQQIASHLGTNETLLICPKKFEPGCEKVDARITIKKIPQSILKACQFGKKEYLLPIKESAMEEVDEEEGETED